MKLLYFLKFWCDDKLKSASDWQDRERAARAGKKWRPPLSRRLNAATRARAYLVHLHAANQDVARESDKFFLSVRRAVRRAVSVGTPAGENFRRPTEKSKRGAAWLEKARLKTQ